MTNPSAVPDGSASIGRVPWGLVALAFAAVMLDGFDAVTFAFSIPALAKEWGVAPASFSMALVLTNLGVVIGYMASGPLGARIGERRLLTLGIFGYAGFTILVAATLPLQSMVLLDLLRFLAGGGLGAVLPVAVPLAAAHAPARRRELVSMLVTLGLASGGTLAGFLGGTLLRTIGVTGVFWVAVILALFVGAGLASLKLPVRAGSPAKQDSKEHARIGKLFEKDVRLSTILLWSFSFLVFLAGYTLTNWVPTLLAGYGFSEYEAPLGLAMFSLGGMIGGLVLIPLAARIGIARSLVLMPALGLVSMLLATVAGVPHLGVLIALAGTGAGLVAGQVGQLTMAVSLYPEGTRSTGVGWLAAVGRIGAIVGPGVGGILLAAGFSAPTFLGLVAIPVAVAVVGAIVITWRELQAIRDAAGEAEAEYSESPVG